MDVKGDLDSSSLKSDSVKREKEKKQHSYPRKPKAYHIAPFSTSLDLQRQFFDHDIPVILVLLKRL